MIHILDLCVTGIHNHQNQQQVLLQKLGDFNPVLISAITTLFSQVNSKLRFLEGLLFTNV